MLGKLIKYEFKATYSIHLLMCAIVLGMSVICGLFSLIPTDQIVDDITHAGTVFSVMLQSLLQMLLGLMMSGITVTTLVLIAVRFYKNLLGDEGYLMFTLPVKSWQLITSKLLTSLVWMVGSVLVLFASFFILIDVEMPTFREFWQSFIQANQAMLREIHTPLWLLMALPMMYPSSKGEISLGSDKSIASFNFYIIQ